MRRLLLAVLLSSLALVPLRADKPIKATLPAPKAVELKPLDEVWEAAFVQNAAGVDVKIGHIRFGGMASLALIQVPTVVAVRFYTASEAHGRFGPGHLHGALDVTTAPPPVEP